MNARDIQSLISSLKEIGIPQDDINALGDSDITQEQAQKLMDLNSDGNTDELDFMKLRSDTQIQAFLNVRQILSRHGIGLIDSVEDSVVDKMPMGCAASILFLLGVQLPNGCNAAPRAFWHDKHFIMKMVKKDGLTLSGASAELRDDPEVVLTALSQNRNAFRFASERLKIEHPVVHRTKLESVDFPQRVFGISAEGSELSSLLFDGPVPMWRGFFDPWEDTKLLDDRPSAITNRDPAYNTHNRPIALIISPKTDYNGAFDRIDERVIDSLDMKEKYTVYYEAETDTEVAEIIQLVTKEHGNCIDTLIIAGHGSSDDITFGPAGWFRSKEIEEEEYLFDINDFGPSSEEHMEKTLADAVCKGGEIMLYGCSTGKGGQMAVNLVNTIADFVPRDTSISGKLVDSEIPRLDEPLEYTIQGRK